MPTVLYITPLCNSYAFCMSKYAGYYIIIMCHEHSYHKNAISLWAIDIILNYNVIIKYDWRSLLCGIGDDDQGRTIWGAVWGSQDEQDNGRITYVIFL